LLMDLNGPIGTFIDNEFNFTRLLQAPVPSLNEQQPVILARFRTEFPPEWYDIVMATFDVEAGFVLPIRGDMD
jgi:hypothetical protein